MTRVAAIDCGTNSIRLLVADATTGPDGAAELSDVVRLMEVVRLGQGVDRTGELAPEALERTLAATDTYAALCEEHGVEAVRFVATSATRDARNRDVFVDGVRERLGVEPEVISGTEEAALSFAGAVRALAPEDGPALVVDIGGGSTELVLGDVGPTAGPPTASTSLDMGCVRMTERHLVRDGAVTDPPTAGQVAAMRADIESALDLAEKTVPLREAHTLVGLAGSVTTVSAIAQDLPGYDSAAIHHSRISRERVREISDWLLRSTHAERAAVPSMHPGRVDVIAAGALVLLAVMERVDAREVVASEHDILDGIAWSLAADGPR